MIKLKWDWLGDEELKLSDVEKDEFFVLIFFLMCDYLIIIERVK